MNAVIFDTETTGLVDPVIVEVGLVRLTSLRPLEWSEGVAARFNPGKPIALGAMATHHITDEDVADCPPASEFALPAGTEYVIGHNVDYDVQAIGNPPVKRICTLALCRKMWPEADSHSLTAMLYLLDRERARGQAREAHAAITDVLFCGVILDAILKRLDVPTLEELHHLSEIARVPDIMPFGKHKGMRIADMPPDYKRCLLGQPDVDPYLRQALMRRPNEAMTSEAREASIRG